MEKNKKKKVENNRVSTRQKQGGGKGRKTGDNKELFKRRKEISILDNMGIAKNVIAEKYGIDIKTVYTDLKSFAPMESQEEAKREFAERFKEIIRRGFNKNDLWVAMEANAKLANLYGFMKNDINVDIDVDVDIEGRANPYAEFTDDELIAEHNRQLEVIKSRNKKKR